MSVLLEQIRHKFQVSDTMLGLFGTLFGSAPADRLGKRSLRPLPV
jgi:hypothetical protein